MRQRHRPFAVSFLLALSACTQPATFAEVAGRVPQPPANEARIYFYRAEGPYDMPSWTTVYLNGHSVGDAPPGAVFYRDVPPGQYEITLRSPGLYPFQFKSVALDPGQTLYVRIESRKDWSYDRGNRRSLDIFVVQPVDPAIGRQEIQGLTYRSG